MGKMNVKFAIQCNKINFTVCTPVDTINLTGILMDLNSLLYKNNGDCFHFKQLKQINNALLMFLYILPHVL